MCDLVDIKWWSNRNCKASALQEGLFVSSKSLEIAIIEPIPPITRYLLSSLSVLMSKPVHHDKY